MKLCITCNKTKEFNDFYKNDRYKDQRYYECIECSRFRARKVYAENPEKNIKNTRKWQKDNKDRWNKYKANYERKRRGDNPGYRIMYNLKSRISKALRNNQKSGTSLKQFGCSVDQLKTHLEKQFYNHPLTYEPMTWENYGKKAKKEPFWEVDHIIPTSRIDPETSPIEEIEKMNHYTNLQPMWSHQNNKKSNK